MPPRATNREQNLYQDRQHTGVLEILPERSMLIQIFMLIGVGEITAPTKPLPRKPTMMFERTLSRCSAAITPKYVILGQLN